MPASPASQTPREQLAGHLAPLLPKTWKLVPYSRNLDRLESTTVMLHATEIRRGIALGALEVDFTISVSSPKSDPTSAQTDLDDDVLALVHKVASTSWLLFRNATPTVVQDFLSWDLTVTVITREDA